MHFCPNCENMYYLKIGNENAEKLIYYCRNCGNEDDNLTIEDGYVSKTFIKHSEQKYSQAINEYTHLDPTLPRTKAIKCPNHDCDTNKTGDAESIDKEIIYIRYDDMNMKYIYLCSSCNTTWKTYEQ